MIRKAFTLIELLVVIAIIAILAAILFPVFAQAKVSAKAAVAISDVKQQSLAMIMYAGDADDYWSNSCSWNTGNDPLSFGAGAAFSTWTWLINPYEKNQDIDIDPLGPLCVVPAGWPKIIAESFNPTFGYNVGALSPYYNAMTHAISATAVEFPANTVLLSSKFSTNGEWLGSNAGNEGYWWSGSGPNRDNGPILNTTMDPPNCGTINAYCIGNWGVGGGWTSFVPTGTVAGELTGGNSLRGMGASEVSFCDGHTKKMAPGNLGAGTNWSYTLPDGSLVVNNLSKYLWYAIPETGN
jgi:prepilin-type N-terminal cleavage/methylation domain-containing protein